MEALWQTYKDRGILLLGVNIDEPQSVVEDFAREFKLTYPVLLGNTSLKNAYNIAGSHVSPYPRDYIIGSDGKIIYASAEFDPEEIETVLNTHLTPPSVDVPFSSVDYDTDGKIGFSDFLIFTQAFGKTDPDRDLDGDGKVGFSDFLTFAQQFGRTRP